MSVASQWKQREQRDKDAAAAATTTAATVTKPGITAAAAKGKNDAPASDSSCVAAAGGSISSTGSGKPGKPDTTKFGVPNQGTAPGKQGAQKFPPGKNTIQTKQPDFGLQYGGSNSSKIPAGTKTIASPAQENVTGTGNRKTFGVAPKKEEPATPFKKGEPTSPYKKEEPTSPYKKEEPATPFKKGEPTSPYKKEEPTTPYKKGEPTSPYKSKVDDKKVKVNESKKEPAVITPDTKKPDAPTDDGPLGSGRTKGLAGFWAIQNDEVKGVKKKRLTAVEENLAPMVVENNPQLLEGVVRAEDPGEWKKPIQLEDGYTKNVASSFQKRRPETTAKKAPINLIEDGVERSPDSQDEGSRIKVKDISQRLVHQQSDANKKPKEKLVIDRTQTAVVLAENQPEEVDPSIVRSDSTSQDDVVLEKGRTRNLLELWKNTEVEYNTPKTSTHRFQGEKPAWILEIEAAKGNVAEKDATYEDDETVTEPKIEDETSDDLRGKGEVMLESRFQEAARRVGLYEDEAVVQKSQEKKEEHREVEEKKFEEQEGASCQKVFLENPAQSSVAALVIEEKDRSTERRTSPPVVEEATRTEEKNVEQDQAILKGGEVKADEIPQAPPTEEVSVQQVETGKGVPKLSIEDVPVITNEKPREGAPEITSIEYTISGERPPDDVQLPERQKSSEVPSANEQIALGVELEKPTENILIQDRPIEQNQLVPEDILNEIKPNLEAFQEVLEAIERSKEEISSQRSLFEEVEAGLAALKAGTPDKGISVDEVKSREEIVQEPVDEKETKWNLPDEHATKMSFQRTEPVHEIPEDVTVERPEICTNRIPEEVPRGVESPVSKEESNQFTNDLLNLTPSEKSQENLRKEETFQESKITVSDQPKSHTKLDDLTKVEISNAQEVPNESKFAVPAAKETLSKELERTSTNVLEDVEKGFKSLLEDVEKASTNVLPPIGIRVQSENKEVKTSSDNDSFGSKTSERQLTNTETIPVGQSPEKIEETKLISANDSNDLFFKEAITPEFQTGSRQTKPETENLTNVDDPFGITCGLEDISADSTPCLVPIVPAQVPEIRIQDVEEESRVKSTASYEAGASEQKRNVTESKPEMEMTGSRNNDSTTESLQKRPEDQNRTEEVESKKVETSQRSCYLM